MTRWWWVWCLAMVLLVVNGLQPPRPARGLSCRGGVADSDEALEFDGGEDPDDGGDDDDDDDDDEDDEEDDDEEETDAEAEDEEGAVAEPEPELIFGIEKPVLIRLVVMSALTIFLNTMIPKPSVVAERQLAAEKKAIEEAKAKAEAEAAAAAAEAEKETESDELEVFEEEEEEAA